MQTCENYIEANIEEFWEKFKLLNSTVNKDYITSKASNVVSCKCIKFPKLTEEEFQYFFDITNNSGEKRLVFENCIFTEELDLTKFLNLRKVTFKNCIFEGNVDLSLPLFLLVDLDNCIFNKNFYLKGINTTEKERNLHIRNTKFDSLFHFEKCVLDSSIWFNVDFSKATLKFEAVSFERLKANEIKWSNKIEASRDTFRQLKVLMENQKNFIDSNIFYSMELNEYMKELNKTSIFSNLEDKVVFLFSKITSNFSRSWILPLFWLISLSVILYFFLFCNKMIDMYSLNHFVQFFNPLSKNANEEFKNIYWIWFLHKIFAGFFVYQFIIALRRKTRF